MIGFNCVFLNLFLEINFDSQDLRSDQKTSLTKRRKMGSLKKNRASNLTPFITIIHSLTGELYRPVRLLMSSAPLFYLLTLDKTGLTLTL